MGIAQLICTQLMNEGLPEAEAREKIWMMDYEGLLVTSRTDLSEQQKPFAHDVQVRFCFLLGAQKLFLFTVNTLHTNVNILYFLN